MLAKRQSYSALAANMSVPYSKRPIFGKYIFMNNAVYMGFFTMLILLVIFILGIQILSGIQSPTKFEAKFKQN
jgi:hypothetical protein